MNSEDYQSAVAQEVTDQVLRAVASMYGNIEAPKMSWPEVEAYAKQVGDDAGRRLCEENEEEVMGWNWSDRTCRILCRIGAAVGFVGVAMLWYACIAG